MNARLVFVVLLLAIAALGFYLAYHVKPYDTGAGTNKGVNSAASDEGKAGDKVPVPPIAALPDAEKKNNAGLLLTIESLAKPGLVDRRNARIPNLFVPEGTPPSAFLPPGPFKATWEGNLMVSPKDDYVFGAEGRGKLKITINNVEAYSASGDKFETATEKMVTLRKGPNHFVIAYESPEKGDAIMRLNWRSAENSPTETSGFFAESLSPDLLSFDNANAAFRESRRLHQGRELYATLRCEACHGAEHIGANLAKDGMPELTMDAPNLSEAGRRLNTAWIAKWLKDPRALRLESSMPQLLRGPNAEKDAEDIAGFLATLGAKEDKLGTGPTTEDEFKELGHTFASLGCIGCHVLPDAQKPEPGRLMLAYVRDKWKPAALREFLKKPDAHYAWIRMPDFRLSDEEIENLAKFIQFLPIDKDKTGEPIPELKGKPDVAHGKELVETMSCLNCHNAGTGVTNKAKGPEFKTISGDGWAKGCLAEKEEALGKAPNFHLSAEQRGALLAFAATDRTSLKQEAMPEFAERQIASMRCMACHNRDKTQSVWAPEQNDLDDEQEKYREPPIVSDDPGAQGKTVKQHIPTLTWIGEKLKPEWASKFIDGKMDYKPRIWLRARMPGFHSRAELISKGLAIEHGYPTVNPPDFKPDPELAKIGARIASTKDGFSCAQCHKIGGENVTTKQAFEWPAINFKYVKERIMEPFYYKWMNEPIRMEPGTGMTNFGKGGHNQKDAFFGGDARKQYEALWHYLQTGREIKSPNPEDEGN